jgi:hypothetical protein
MVFLCKLPCVAGCGIVAGENAADAVLRYDYHLMGADHQNDGILECDDSTNAYCQKLLAEYDVSELHRHDVLEYVERRLDGDKSITIIL